MCIKPGHHLLRLYCFHSSSSPIDISISHLHTITTTYSYLQSDPRDIQSNMAWNGPPPHYGPQANNFWDFARSFDPSGGRGSGGPGAGVDRTPGGGNFFFGGGPGGHPFFGGFGRGDFPPFGPFGGLGIDMEPGLPITTKMAMSTTRQSDAPPSHNAKQLVRTPP